MISKALGHKSKLYSSFKLLAGSRTRWMVLLLWCRHSYNEDHCLSLQSLLSSPAAASCSRHDDDDQDDQDYNANDHHHLHVLPPIFSLQSCSLKHRSLLLPFNIESIFNAPWFGTGLPRPEGCPPWS